MTEREKLLQNFEQNLLDGDKINSCGKAMLDAKDAFEFFCDFIIEDRKRIVAPLDNFKRSRLHMFGVMGWDKHDLPYKTIDETLKNAGIE